MNFSIKPSLVSQIFVFSSVSSPLSNETQKIRKLDRVETENRRRKNKYTRIENKPRTRLRLHRSRTEYTSESDGARKHGNTLVEHTNPKGRKKDQEVTIYAEAKKQVFLRFVEALFLVQRVAAGDHTTITRPFWVTYNKCKRDKANRELDLAPIEPSTGASETGIEQYVFIIFISVFSLLFSFTMQTKDGCSCVFIP